MGYCLPLTARQVPSAPLLQRFQKPLRLSHEEHSVSKFQACDTITDSKFDSLLRGALSLHVDGTLQLPALPQLPLSSVWAVTEKTGFPLQSREASQGHSGCDCLGLVLFQFLAVRAMAFASPPHETDVSPGVALYPESVQTLSSGSPYAVPSEQESVRARIFFFSLCV